MSTKFEQLLDYLVNEDMEKANELFHEIVVEKSRDIYENLIAEEEDEEKEMDEAMDDEMDESADEEMDESMEDEEMDESADEEADESVDLEDSYMMDGGDDTGDATDDFGGEISADGHNFDHPDADGEEGSEGQEDSAIMDIKNAIAELEAAFAELEQAQGDEEADMGMDSEFGDEEDGESEDEMMGLPTMENRRVTREYVEKVNHNYGGNTQKQQGQYVGGHTGELQSAPVEGKSPVSSGKGKPTSGANASNIATHHDKIDQDGTTPHGKVGGLVKSGGGQFTGTDWEKNSKAGANAGKTAFKTKVPAHGLAGNTRNNGSEGSPVGSGTGDKAGQTGGNTNSRSIENGQTRK